MKATAILALEQDGRLVPLCRSSRKGVVEVVAQAALADIRAAASEQLDEVLAALLRQEGERLEKALTTLGLGSG